MTAINATRINNDVNGNPRFVIYHGDFIRDGIRCNKYISVSEGYAWALMVAKTIGGKKFHNKQYGGGIVIQTYESCIEGLIDQAIDSFEKHGDYKKAKVIADRLLSLHYDTLKTAADMQNWRTTALQYICSVVSENVPSRTKGSVINIAAYLIAEELSKV